MITIPKINGDTLLFPIYDGDIVKESYFLTNSWKNFSILNDTEAKEYIKKEVELGHITPKEVVEIDSSKYWYVDRDYVIHNLSENKGDIRGIRRDLTLDDSYVIRKQQLIEAFTYDAIGVFTSKEDAITSLPSDIIHVYRAHGGKSLDLSTYLEYGYSIKNVSQSMTGGKNDNIYSFIAVHFSKVKP